jgi:hypothetical protein
VRWSHRTKDFDDLEVGSAVQNQTGNNPTKWDKTGIVLENKPNSNIRVDGSRHVTMRNRMFVRQLEPMLRNDTRPEPVRRRAVQQPPVRPELAEKNLPSQPPVQEDHAAVRGGVPDVRFEEVQDTEDVHHQVDAWQDD